MNTTLRTATLLLAALCAACDGTTAPPVSSDYQSLPADNIIFGMQHSITVDGVRRALLRADTALIFEDSSATHLKVVNLEMFDGAGQLSSTLTSNTAEYNTVSERTVARGNVIVIMPGPDGRTIWTEELHYDPQTKRIWSDVPTRILENSGREFRGQGFTADDQFVNIDIRGGSGEGLPLPIR
jgi:LPS export ABC transporter protein LptC